MLAIVIQPFKLAGTNLQPGQKIDIPEKYLVPLHGKVIRVRKDIPEHLQAMEQDAAFFSRFCMAHQNTFPDGHCPTKSTRGASLDECLGWRLKTGKTNLHANNCHSSRGD